MGLPCIVIMGYTDLTQRVGEQSIHPDRIRTPTKTNLLKQFFGKSRIRKIQYFGT